MKGLKAYITILVALLFILPNCYSGPPPGDPPKQKDKNEMHMFQGSENNVAITGDITTIEDAIAAPQECLLVATVNTGQNTATMIETASTDKSGAYANGSTIYDVKLTAAKPPGKPGQNVPIPYSMAYWRVRA